MNVKEVTQNENTPITQLPDYKSEIVDILRSNLTPKLVKERILAYHENDIASAMDLLKKDERNKLYSILSTDELASIFEYSENINEYIGEINLRKRAEVLSLLEATVLLEYLRGLDKSERKTLIDLMREDTKRELSLLNSFDDDEIGSKMTTNFVSISEGISVRQAMKSLIEQAAENDNISTIYVTDREGLLVGAIDLKDLIIARESAELADIIVTSYPYVYANELIEDCIERIKGYSEDSIPVLDRENKLKGVLTSQDLTDLVDDELGDDYAKLAGLSAEEDLHEPLKKSIVKRLPWLIILLGLGLLVSSVVGAFEGVISSLAVIVSFQSLILGMAGNVGTQSLAVTIRVLMDEELTAKQKLYLIHKEARVGFTNGFILGAISIVFVGLYLIIFKEQQASFAFLISSCTGIALLVSVFLSSITGTTIPLALKKLKIDPAVASGPLISTLNDLVAVITYYGLAWLLLINLLNIG